MTRGRVAIIAGLLIVGVAAVFGYRAYQAREASKEAPLVLYGNVDIREVDVAFRQPGRIARLTVDEGDAVTAGQVIAELDAEPYRVSLSLAEAQLASAEAELEKLRNGNRPQEISRADEAVRQNDATFKNAQTEYERAKALVASGVVPQRDLDSAKAARDVAAAGLGSARQSASLLRAGSRKEDVAAGEAKLASAAASVAQARLALADTRLVAPGDGVVVSRVREAGAMVTTGQQVFSISLRQPLFVRAYVSERQMSRVAPGTRVQFSADSSRKTFEGQVGFVSPRAEFTPKSVETTDLRTDLVYRLRIVVAEADDELRQGMPVTIRVADESQ